jgi:hydrogenase maturation protein HypF
MNTTGPNQIRAAFDVRGTVQGVGFRPAVFRLAREANLGGWVQNRSGTVRLVLEGPAETVQRFARDLLHAVPPPALIASLDPLGPAEPIGHEPVLPFEIRPSAGDDAVEVTIPSDIGMCSECAREALDPTDRRYGYAFTTCSLCGPRYTVVHEMPFDRERTTLSAFPMCPPCRSEYEDPRDRRFHAQTTACPACGPRLQLERCDGTPIAGDPLRACRALLADGAIVAVRGVGGFLLAADAFNRATLTRLRARKRRPHKPFAVMARNPDVLSLLCRMPPGAEQLLASDERPIVILDLHDGPEGGLPLDLLTPDAETLGVMLPTSPLHLLLMEPLRGDPIPRFDLLVMTSGNRRGEPICIGNAEARERLGDIADAFLLHDREINLRNDDSLFALPLGRPQVWRRARGYAPHPIRLGRPLQRVALAMGAELKNTVALGYSSHVVLSPHVGDLGTPEANDGFAQILRCLPAFLRRVPETVAVDLHPDMHATLAGRRLAGEMGIPAVAVQHHHAHAVACLEEHGFDEGLALVMDGTGMGDDGTVWGAELLDVSPGGYVRLATFEAAPLPGGDAAVREPIRQLVGRWVAAGIQPDGSCLRRMNLSHEHWEAWRSQVVHRVNAPGSHAAGRLFDAFAAALELHTGPITYEAQAAIRLESAARRWRGAIGKLPTLPFTTAEAGGMLRINWAPSFARLAEEVPDPGSRPAWAMACHHAVARAAEAVIQYGMARSAHRRVALSGGVMMNRVLIERLVPALQAAGIQVLLHERTPPNDGCVAFGQAIVAGRSDSCA